MLYNIYCDESRHTDKKYMVIGGIIVPYKHIDTLNNDFSKLNKLLDSINEVILNIDNKLLEIASKYYESNDASDLDFYITYFKHEFDKVSKLINGTKESLEKYIDNVENNRLNDITLNSNVKIIHKKMLAITFTYTQIEDKFNMYFRDKDSKKRAFKFVIEYNTSIQNFKVLFDKYNDSIVLILNNDFYVLSEDDFPKTLTFKD